VPRREKTKKKVFVSTRNQQFSSDRIEKTTKIFFGFHRRNTAFFTFCGCIKM